MSNMKHIIARPSTIRRAIKRTIASIRDLPDVAKAIVAASENGLSGRNLSYRQELADLLACESIVLERLMVALQVAEDQNEIK